MSKVTINKGGESTTLEGDVLIRQTLLQEGIEEEVIDRVIILINRNPIYVDQPLEINITE